MEILHCTQYMMAYTIILLLQGVHKILARPSTRDVKRLRGFWQGDGRNVQSNTRVTCLAAPGHYQVWIIAVASADIWPPVTGSMSTHLSRCLGFNHVLVSNVYVNWEWLSAVCTSALLAPPRVGGGKVLMKEENIFFLSLNTIVHKKCMCMCCVVHIHLDN